MEVSQLLIFTVWKRIIGGCVCLFRDLLKTIETTPQASIQNEATDEKDSPIFGPRHVPDSPIFRTRSNQEESPIFSKMNGKASIAGNDQEGHLTFPESWSTSPTADCPDLGLKTAREKKQPINTERRQKVAWPRMNAKDWEQFNEDLDVIMLTALTGTVERILQALSTLT